MNASYELIHKIMEHKLNTGSTPQAIVLDDGVLELLKKEMDDRCTFGGTPGGPAPIEGRIYFQGIEVFSKRAVVIL